MELMNQNQISQLLYSPEPEFKSIGIQQVLTGLPDTSRIALEYMARCHENDLNLLAANLPRHLPFLRECFGPPRNSGKKNFAYFDDIQADMEVFHLALSKVIQELEPNLRQDFLNRLAGFQGVGGETRELIREQWGDKPAAAFDSSLQKARSKLMERQLMIFPTYTCNLSCPYCFAKGLKEKDMPLEKVIQLIDWAQQNGATKITFCGGEPTIYPHFPEVLDETKKRGLRTYFATNLLLGPGVLERLKPDLVDALIVHVAHRDTYKGSQWQAFMNNVKKVLEQGVSQSMRINMLDKNCDFSHMFELTDRFGLKEVQFALAFPGVTGNNQFINLENFRSIIPSVVQLMKECTDSGLKFSLSKPIPLCLFLEPDRYWMIRRIEYPLSCSVFADVCTHNACISPAGNVSPCLGLMDIMKPVEGFSNWDDLSEYCTAEIMPLLYKPLFEHCPDCFLYERRLCQGACLSHKNIEIKEIPCQI